MYRFFLCHLLIYLLFLGLISAVVLTETKKSWMWPSRSCLHIPSSDSLNQILTDQWKMHLSFTILARCIEMQEDVFWKLYKDCLSKKLILNIMRKTLCPVHRQQLLHFRLLISLDHTEGFTKSTKTPSGLKILFNRTCSHWWPQFNLPGVKMQLQSS